MNDKSCCHSTILNSIDNNNNNNFGRGVAACSSGSDHLMNSSNHHHRHKSDTYFGSSFDEEHAGLVTSIADQKLSSSTIMDNDHHLSRSISIGDIPVQLGSSSSSSVMLMNLMNMFKCGSKLGDYHHLDLNQTDSHLNFQFHHESVLARCFPTDEAYQGLRLFILFYLKKNKQTKFLNFIIWRNWYKLVYWIKCGRAVFGDSSWLKRPELESLPNNPVFKANFPF